MKDEMNLTEAIHILREEGVRCARMAEDMAEDPLDQDGRCLEWVKRYRKRAQAIDMVVSAAQKAAEMPE